MGTIVLPDSGNPIAAALQQVFSDFQKRRAADAVMNEQKRQFDLTRADQQPLTAAQIRASDASAGASGAQTKKLEQEMSDAQADAVTKGIIAKAEKIAAAGEHEKAAQFVVAAAKNFMGQPGVRERLSAYFTETPDTNADVMSRNAFKYGADATGRVAAGGQGAGDVNLTTKVLTNEQLTAPAFGNQAQREMGPKALEQSVAVAGGRAPDANAKLNAQTQITTQGMQDTTQLKIAKMNNDIAALSAKSKADAATEKPMFGEAAKIYALAETVQPEIEQLRERFKQDRVGTIQSILTGTDRGAVKLVDSIAEKYGRIHSGGVINKDEEAKFKRALGSWMDIPFGDDAEADASLNRILGEMRTVATSIKGGGSEGNSQTIRYDAQGNLVQ